MYSFVDGTDVIPHSAINAIYFQVFQQSFAVNHVVGLLEIDEGGIESALVLSVFGDKGLKDKYMVSRPKLSYETNLVFSENSIV